MILLSSRRHPYKFYLSILLGTLFFMGLGTALAVIFYRHNLYNQGETKDMLMPVFSIVCWLIGIYLVIRYYKNAPLFVIANDHMILGKETIVFSDIEKIDLTGKQSFSFIVGHPMEATTIMLKDGSRRIVFDDMYANASDLKLLLAEYAVKLPAELHSLPKKRPSANLDSYETFKGHALFSLSGLTLWLPIGIVLFLTLQKPILNTGALAFLLIYSLLWFILFAYRMNYFIVTSTQLLVKNHYLVSKKHTYEIDDIKELVFETRSKMPNMLRVITKNYKNKLFLAGSLHDKHWLALKDTMEKEGITVRNECI